MTDKEEKAIDEKLSIVNGRIKNYKKNPSDTVYYRLVIKPYYEKKCRQCLTKLTKELYCKKCDKKLIPNKFDPPYNIGKIKKSYVQDTFNETTGEVKSGSKGLLKILYNKDKVENSQTVVFLMSEQDCDFCNQFNYDFPFTTAIGAPTMKLAPYLWQYYIEDLKGKHVVFIARSDAEEKHLLLLIKNIVLPSAKEVSLFNICRILGQRDRKLKLRKQYDSNIKFFSNLPLLIHDMTGRVIPMMLEERLKELNKKVMPEEYIDGFADIANLKEEIEGDIRQEKLKEEAESKRIAAESNKHILDKKRAEQIARRQKDYQLTEKIRTVIAEYFPAGKKRWLISNKKMSEILHENGVKVSPEKLGRLMQDKTLCVKKTKSRGHINLHLVKPKRVEDGING